MTHTGLEAQPRLKRGRLLLLLPELPIGSEGAGAGEAHRLLQELAKDWELRLAVAGPSGAETGYLDSLGAGAELVAEGRDRWERLRSAMGPDECSAVLVVDHAATRNGLAVARAASDQPLVRIILGAAAPRRSRDATDEAWHISADPPAAVWLRLRRRLLRLAAGGAARPGRLPLSSIVIPCFNNLEYTRQCLESLRRHTTAPYEIIAVDNGSRDGTADFLSRQSRVKLIRNQRNLGFAKAMNQGLRRARGGYVVWLNNDVLVTPGWLERLIAAAQRAPGIGAVGPCTNEAVGAQQLEAVSYRDTDKGLLLFSEAWALAHQGQALSVPRLVGFCLLVKRAAMDRIGLLDERFGLGCYEDYDYCLRLRQAGYDTVCALDAFVHHHGHKSFASRDDMLAQVRANREVFLDKWCRQALGFLDELDAHAARRSADRRA